VVGPGEIGGGEGGDGRAAPAGGAGGPVPAGAQLRGQLRGFGVGRAARLDLLGAHLPVELRTGVGVEDRPRESEGDPGDGIDEQQLLLHAHRSHGLQCAAPHRRRG